MTFGVAEEANASAGDNGACSDGGGRKDKYGGCQRTGVECRDPSQTGSLCYGSG